MKLPESGWRFCSLAPGKIGDLLLSQGSDLAFQGKAFCRRGAGILRLIANRVGDLGYFLAAGL